MSSLGVLLLDDTTRNGSTLFTSSRNTKTSTKMSAPKPSHPEIMYAERSSDSDPEKVSRAGSSV